MCSYWTIQDPHAGSVKAEFGAGPAPRGRTPRSYVAPPPGQILLIMWELPDMDAASPSLHPMTALIPPGHQKSEQPVPRPQSWPTWLLCGVPPEFQQSRPMGAYGLLILYLRFPADLPMMRSISGLHSDYGISLFVSFLRSKA